jgi:hypothetical protein
MRWEGVKLCFPLSPFFSRTTPIWYSIESSQIFAVGKLKIFLARSALFFLYFLGVKKRNKKRGVNADVKGTCFSLSLNMGRVEGGVF